MFLFVVGKPRFLDPVDKHNVNEGETAFITFRVEGDPVPQVEWFKVPEKDMSCNPRLVPEFSRYLSLQINNSCLFFISLLAITVFRVL